MTITSDGGAISVAGIRGDSSETVTITANVTDGGNASTTETIALTGAIGNLDEIGAVTLNADDGITMMAISHLQIQRVRIWMSMVRSSSAVMSSLILTTQLMMEQLISHLPSMV